MNRSVKLIAVLILIATAALCFAGCGSSDDNLSNTVILSNDRESLTYNGETYVKVPKDADLFIVQMTNKKKDVLLDVKQEGVPQMITGIFKNNAYYNTSRDLVRVEFWHINKLIISPVAYQPPTECYCREDAYEIILDAQENAVADRIGFEYIFHETVGPDFSFVLGTLSEESSKEILDYIDNPDCLSKEAFSEIQNTMVNSVTYGMYQCDESGIVAKRLNDYDICKNYSSEAYLVNKTTSEAVKLSKETALEIKFDYLTYVGSYEGNIQSNENFG